MSNVAANARVRLAVISTDVSSVVHAGGAVVTEVRTFDLPTEIAEYIAKLRTFNYTQVSLAVEVDA